VPQVLRRGARGEAVRDLQQRLTRAGQGPDGDEPGEFGDATEAAVRAFQTERRLRVDGIVGRETWSSLVESGYGLGDRLLYLRSPMLRGDDVADLQLRLNALGFDAGREDGIFGDETRGALVEFQAAAAIPADGICGQTTIDALGRVGSFASGSAAGLRERERLLAGPRQLAGRRVYVVAAPGLAVLGEAVMHGLLERGATAVLDTSGDGDSCVAQEANRFEADLLLGLRAGDGQGLRCTYYAGPRFRSEVGLEVATAICAELGRVLPGPDEVRGRASPLLRETRMPAVVCELVPEDDVDAMGELVGHAGDAARAIVDGVARAIEGAVGGESG
jgi:N-acetylmuramoyl-L-alanine amidase